MIVSDIPHQMTLMRVQKINALDLDLMVLNFNMLPLIKTWIWQYIPS